MGLLVGVLGHDGGEERVVVANTKAKSEAEEAERGHDGFGSPTEREVGGHEVDDHQHQRHVIDLLAAEPIAEPIEEVLAGERAAEGDAGDDDREVGRQRSRRYRDGVGVVDLVEELGDGGVAEEVLGVSEESHAGDDDSYKVVPLRLGCVQHVQHLQLRCYLGTKGEEEVVERDEKGLTSNESPFLNASTQPFFKIEVRIQYQCIKEVSWAKGDAEKEKYPSFWTVYSRKSTRPPPSALRESLTFYFLHCLVLISTSG
ncbi:hypothetical protein ZIOFF_013054 [Zingiber officinale]|uniref:Uncharacterized protein n=1 Tax=Zingiber officinale TaxID=94328 RepID=A0A8J5LTX0_ZINOF|nr:hypothetical protein ZIOFF_013054 [Zingiber officinale]